MTQRTKRLTIIGLIVLILLLLLFFALRFLFSSSDSEPVNDTVVEEVVEQEPDPVPERPTISEQELEVEREERNTSSSVISLSKTFVERFGSYSNEANFANLEDVLPLMSREYAAETEAFLVTAVEPETFYSISTAVITVDVEAQTETEARVRLTTQREEAIESPRDSEVKFQDILLTFVKEAGAWKIDSATWL